MVTTARRCGRSRSVSSRLARRRSSADTLAVSWSVSSAAMPRQASAVIPPPAPPGRVALPGVAPARRRPSRRRRSSGRGSGAATGAAPRGSRARRSPRRRSRATLSASATVEGRWATMRAVVPASTCAERAAHLLLGVHVQRGQRIVEYQHGRPGQDGAGQRDALALPAGQRHALLPDPGVQAPRQVVATKSAWAAASACLDVAVGGVRRAEAHVLPDAGREQRRVLERAADRRAQHLERQRPDVGAVDGDPAGGRVGQPGTSWSRVVLPAPVAPVSPSVRPGSSSRQTPRRTGLTRARVAELDPVEDQPGGPGGRRRWRPRRRAGLPGAAHRGLVMA